MFKIISITLLIITPVLAQCDWNEDGDINVLDVVATVNCILTDCMWVDGCVDIDGNSYNTVLIGDQHWMAENLMVTHYNDGNEIDNITNSGSWSSLSSGAYCDYNNDPDNTEIYGRLYNWYAVDDDRGICPEGWHVPTDEEWMELEMALGMSYEDAHDTGYRGTNQGSQLAGSSELWSDGDLVNNEAFGTSGFIALPGGYRSGSNGVYYGGMGIGGGYFWSTSAYNNNQAWNRDVSPNNSGVDRVFNWKRSGFAVRCVEN